VKIKRFSVEQIAGVLKQAEISVGSSMPATYSRRVPRVYSFSLLNSPGLQRVPSGSLFLFAFVSRREDGEKRGPGDR
jgi:hypothetical protein